MKTRQYILSAITLAAAIGGAMAESIPARLADQVSSTNDPSARGHAIARAADLRDQGWGDWSARAEMILSNAQGQTSSRQMHFSALEQVEEGDKRLITFDEPRDVKGTAFLVFSKRTGNDDRWLFLPALARIKRISSSNQSGPFVGSEFAYEDLSSQEVDKYTYRYLGTENIDGMEAYLVERIPTDPRSGYTRQLNWYDTEEFRTLRTEYYDRKGDLLKSFTAGDWQLHNDNWWRAGTFTMVNHQTGKTTVLKWSDFTFTEGLSERDFSQASLRNAR